LAKYFDFEKFETHKIICYGNMAFIHEKIACFCPASFNKPIQPAIWPILKYSLADCKVLATLAISAAGCSKADL